MPINNGMTIDGLNTVSSLTAQDEVPVWDKEASGEPTKKITAQNFASSIKTLESLLGTGDVVNNLTSDDTDKPLSANMGKTLNEAMANIKIVNVGSVTFSNGAGTKAVSSATTNSRLIAQRQQGTPTSIILTATCSTNGIVAFGAYDTSGNGSNFTGDLNGIILLIDDRLLP